MHKINDKTYLIKTFLKEGSLLSLFRICGPFQDFLQKEKITIDNEEYKVKDLGASYTIGNNCVWEYLVCSP